MSTRTANHVSLDKYDDDDLFSTWLRYGLFLGAIFQLICIGSSILLPSISSSESSAGTSEGFEDSRNDVPRRLHKLRKQDKKKRR